MSSRPPRRAAPAFEERQSFRRPPVLGLLAAMLVLVALRRRRLRPEEGQCAVAPALSVAATTGAIVWLLSMELHTEVDAGGVWVRFRRGVGAHHFAPSDIARARPVTYRPVAEFGGWGLRWGRGGSRAFSVSGNRGVEIVDLRGRRWVLGSERPEELAAAIATLGAAIGRELVYN